MEYIKFFRELYNFLMTINRIYRYTVFIQAQKVKKGGFKKRLRGVKKGKNKKVKVFPSLFALFIHILSFQQVTDFL